MKIKAKNKRAIILQKFKIEKRRNKEPNDVIYFQSDEAVGFYAPKFIYLAFSENPKTEYKSATKSVLVDFIFENCLEIKFTKNAN
jgi:hypothetical protein